jgi:hypothetical protein
MDGFLLNLIHQVLLKFDEKVKFLFKSRNKNMRLKLSLTLFSARMLRITRSKVAKYLLVRKLFRINLVEFNETLYAKVTFSLCFVLLSIIKQIAQVRLNCRTVRNPPKMFA